MMVYRAHFEEPFAMGQLEISDLKNHRKGLQNVDQSAEQHHKGIFCKEGQPDHKASQKERAGIAHENPCRVKIVHQKAGASARQGRRKQQYTVVFHQKCAENRIEQPDHQCDRGSQPVDPVGQIDRIDHSRQKHQAKSIVEYPESGIGQPISVAEEGDV